MSEDLFNQQKVWDFRAAHWDEWGFDVPLAPNEQELKYQQKFVKPGSDVLVLGATKGLCKAMFDISDSVTSVDFSPEAINQFRVDGVNYVCSDWITFLESNQERYDNIVTDNGLFCLEFPAEWQRIIKAIYNSLRPNGVFCSRFFLSAQTPLKNEYINPNLSRIMPAMGKAAKSTDWTVIKSPRDEHDPYPARYVFPPKEVVKNMFQKYIVVGELVPTYEEGEHFVTIAFQREPV